MNRVYYTLFIYIRELNLNLNLFVRTWTLGLLHIIYIYKGTKLKPKPADCFVLFFFLLNPSFFPLSDRLKFVSVLIILYFARKIGKVCLLFGYFQIYR